MLQSHLPGRRDREPAPGWCGRIGRIDLPAVQALLESLGGVVDSFVCGPDGFVEAASALLLQAGQPREARRTERFGPTGSQRSDLWGVAASTNFSRIDPSFRIKRRHR